MMLRQPHEEQNPVFVFREKSAGRMIFATVGAFAFVLVSLVIVVAELPKVHIRMVLCGAFFLVAGMICFRMIFRQKILFYNDKVAFLMLFGAQEYLYENIADVQYGNNAIFLYFDDAKVVNISKKQLGDTPAGTVMSFLRQKWDGKRFGVTDPGEEMFCN